jgi:hypothetical protein
MTDEGLQLIGEWIDDVSDVVSATWNCFLITVGQLSKNPNDEVNSI